MRLLPTKTANLFIRNRWVCGRGWNRLADGTLEKIYVMSSMGLETLNSVEEPPEAKTVWYRCDQCGDKWKYYEVGRPPENCPICEEKDCMERL